VRNSIFKKSALVGTLALHLLTACSTDDSIRNIDNNTNPNPITEGRVELPANVDFDLTLKSNTIYELNNRLIVSSGSKLTIPKGTNIIARAGGEDVYIAILKGAQIDIQGTVDDPVIITSSEGNPGDWGGLTIVGDATTTAGTDAIAEVGNFVYGGTNDTDNSGSIKNLLIKGTGAQINPDSQFNGISFYAVGSGTVVENIADRQCICYKHRFRFFYCCRS